MIERVRNYAYLMRLDKPIGTLLLLWPTLCALLLASEASVDMKTIWLFCLGAFFARSMGCVINDFFDKDIDQKVLRTSQRPIASGKVSSFEALVLFGFLSIPSMFILFQLNELSIYMGLGAALLILLYPLAKRFLAIPQMILGLAFSFGIPIAFASQDNLSLITWVIFLANFFLVIAYDTVYGMIDATDDEKLNIGNSARYFGRRKEKWVFLLGLAHLLIYFFVGLSLNLDLSFFFFLSLCFGIVFFQNFQINLGLRQIYLTIFKGNNWIGVFLFFGILFGF